MTSFLFLFPDRSFILKVHVVNGQMRPEHADFWVYDLTMRGLQRNCPHKPVNQQLSPRLAQWPLVCWCQTATAVVPKGEIKSWCSRCQQRPSCRRRVSDIAEMPTPRSVALIYVCVCLRFCRTKVQSHSQVGPGRGGEGERTHHPPHIRISAWRCMECCVWNHPPADLPVILTCTGALFVYWCFSNVVIGLGGLEFMIMWVLVRIFYFLKADRHEGHIWSK